MRALVLILAALLTFGCRDSGEKVSDGIAGQPGTETADTAMSDTSSTTSPAATATITQVDLDFATKAAQGGLAEVAMADVAIAKARNAAVKAFAERMKSDHTAANGELTSWASAKGVTLPAATDAEHQSGIDHLNGLTGKDFDKSYMDHMVSDHEKTVALFDGAAQTTQDADLKTWATNKLPVLREHLSLARDTGAKVK
jgi:putative membrane protein